MCASVGAFALPADGERHRWSTGAWPQPAHLTLSGELLKPAHRWHILHDPLKTPLRSRAILPHPLCKRHDARDLLGFPCTAVRFRVNYVSTVAN